MPHIVVEYTDNLHEEVVREQLVQRLHRAAVHSGIFPVWGIRTFARASALYAVGDGHADNGFIQVTVRIAPGRNLALRQRIMSELFAAMRECMQGLLASRRIGIQLEVTEFDPAVTTYLNNLTEPGQPDDPQHLRTP